MRDSFNKALLALAEKNPEIMLLVGDIGFKVFDTFVERYPSKFYNLGIAEANMVGMSAGLAMNGKRPFVYTIIPFLTMRAFEQIRVDICMHNVPVILVGVGGGLSYDKLGPTHHAIEDITLMRALPNMNVFSPSDPEEVIEITNYAYKLNKPVYIRLGKGKEPNLFDKQVYPLNNHLYRQIRDGNDITLFATGAILKIAIEAADLLHKEGIELRIINMIGVKPLHEEIVKKAINETKGILALEEHSLIGGFGSAIADICATYAKVPCKKIGLKDEFTMEVGDRDYLLEKHDVTVERIVRESRLLNQSK